MIADGEESSSPVYPNALGLDNEIQRIAMLAGGLDACANDVRNARTDSWTGTSKDGFDAAHLAVVRNWHTAADQHAEAGEVLTRFQSAADDLTRRREWAEQELADADPVLRQTLTEQIERWHGQLFDAGNVVASELRQITERMSRIRRVVDAPSARPTPEPARERFTPQERRYDQGDRPTAPQPRPRLVQYDSVLNLSQLVALNNAVLAVWQGNPQPGRRADRAGSGG